MPPVSRKTMASAAACQSCHTACRTVVVFASVWAVSAWAASVLAASVLAVSVRAVSMSRQCGGACPPVAKVVRYLWCMSASSYICRVSRETWPHPICLHNHSQTGGISRYRVSAHWVELYTFVFGSRLLLSISQSPLRWTPLGMVEPSACVKNVTIIVYWKHHLHAPVRFHATRQ